MKSACGIAGAAVAAATVSVAGVAMLLAPVIEDIAIIDTGWNSANIIVTTDRQFATHAVKISTQDGNTFYADPGSNGQYVARVSRNGVYGVEVTGQGGRTTHADVEVSSIDDMIPTVERYSTGNDRVTIFFADDRSGVDWDSIYAIDSQGRQVFPLHTDAELGSVVFLLPDSHMDIHVTDHAGNHGKTTVSVSLN